MWQICHQKPNDWTLKCPVHGLLFTLPYQPQEDDNTCYERDESKKQGTPLWPAVSSTLLLTPWEKEILFYWKLYWLQLHLRNLIVGRLILLICIYWARRGEFWWASSLVAVMTLEMSRVLSMHETYLKYCFWSGNFFNCLYWLCVQYISDSCPQSHWTQINICPLTG